MYGEALKALKAETLRPGRPLWTRVKVFVSMSVVILKELVGFLFVVPYGLHALLTFISLPKVAHRDRRSISSRNNLDSSSDDGKLLRPSPSYGTNEVQEEKDKNYRSSSFFFRGSGYAGAQEWRGGTTPGGISTVLWRAVQRLLDSRIKEIRSARESGVVIVSDIRYGPRPRNLLDVYLPDPGRDSEDRAVKSSGEQQKHQENSGLSPVVIFVHGGVWASGEPWQYAPLAVGCCRGAGAIVVMQKYTLFPEVLAAEQVNETSAVLTWTLDNIQNYGGDPQQIFLVGHSSGAHLCAMAVWQRTRNNVLSASQTVKHSKECSAEEDNFNEASEYVQNGTAADTRQPYCFIGLSGVYNIGEHLKHEMSRGVALLSCMTPANGGVHNFPKMSPALLLAALHHQMQGKGSSEDESAAQTQMPDCLHWGQERGQAAGQEKQLLRGERSVAAAALRRNDSCHCYGPCRCKNACQMAEELLEQAGAAADQLLDGELLAAMVQLARKSITSSIEDDSPYATSGSLRVRESVALAARNISSAAEPGTKRSGAVPGFGSLPTSSWLPLVLLLCSPADIVVPPKTSVEMREAVRAVRGRAKVVMYDGVGHTAFACWKASDGQLLREDGRWEGDWALPHTEELSARKMSAEAGKEQQRQQLVKDVIDVIAGRVQLEEIDWTL